MSIEERMMFQSSDKAENPVKYNNLGEPITKENNPEKKMWEEMEKNKKIIEEYLQSVLHNEGLDSAKFYFFSVDYYCIYMDQIFPAELALSTFSIRDGVQDTIHFMINPGELPRGLAASAQLYAKENHRRELPPEIEGEIDNETVLSGILSLMNVTSKNIKSIYVFVHEETHESNSVYSAQLTLNQLSMGTEYENKFHALPAELLLFKISKHREFLQQNMPEPKYKAFSSINAVKQAMLRDKYAYSDLGCQYHISIDWSQKCCLSKVRRVGYLFAELCMFVSEKKLPGLHFPIIIHNPTEENLFYNDDDDDNDDTLNLTRSDSFHTSISSLSDADSSLNLTSSISDLSSVSSRTSNYSFINGAKAYIKRL
jgi:piRNA pathway germ-plasm component